MSRRAPDAPPWRPRLAAKARLQHDPIGNQHLLLFPEAALVLNATAAAIVQLCDGTRDVPAIAGELAGRFAGGSATAIADDVAALVARLRSRGLVE